MSTSNSNRTLDVLKAELAELTEEIKEKQNAKAAVKDAIRALGGNGGQPRGPDRRKRVSQDKRVQKVFQFLQSNPEPRAPSEIAVAMDAPHSSTYKAINRLVKEGKIKKVDETPRGQPIVTRNVVTIRPGEGVTPS